MRLSTAIAMGRVLPEDWHGRSFNACALGMAQAAIGIPRESFQRLYANGATEVWPWIIEERFSHPHSHHHDAKMIISDLYYRVLRSAMTLDQLIDWVRSVEPPELEEVADGGRAETISATNPVCAK